MDSGVSELKLKAKIVLLFTLVIVLGTAAMGSFATYTLSSKIKEAAVDKLKSARDERAKEAARREVMEAMNQLEEANRKAKKNQ